MSNMESSHPTPEMIQAYVLGQASEDVIDTVDRHLAECENCRETLREVDNDSFVNCLQKCVEAEEMGRTRTYAVTNPRNPNEGTDQRATREGNPQGIAKSPTVYPGEGDTVLPPEVVDIPALANHERYEVLELVGRGGMGDVYRAEHRMMKRPVALKIIKPELVARKSAVERFRREVEAAARLSHPNIVTSYDAEQAGDLHFLVMEFVDGTDLAEVLEERGPLPVDEACDYVRQVALGLQHAMENDMVHRDIKPHNLMLTKYGQVKILDFGLASLTGGKPEGETVTESQWEREQKSLTQASSFMGTPDYVSPEQATDPRNADIRSDVYSLECTMYHLLTGQVPFPGGKVFDKIDAQQKREPQPIHELRSDVPPGVAEVVDRMMRKEPEERYQSPAEVADALNPDALGAQARTPENADSHVQEEGSMQCSSSTSDSFVNASDGLPCFSCLLSCLLSCS